VVGWRGWRDSRRGSGPSPGILHLGSLSEMRQDFWCQGPSGEEALSGGVRVGKLQGCQGRGAVDRKPGKEIGADRCQLTCRAS